MAVTERGSFPWQTVDRARAEAQEAVGDPVAQEAWQALQMVREAVETLG